MTSRPSAPASFDAALSTTASESSAHAPPAPELRVHSEVGWRRPPPDVAEIYRWAGRTWSVRGADESGDAGERGRVQEWLNAGQWCDIRRFIRWRLAQQRPSDDLLVDCWHDFQLRVKVARSKHSEVMPADIADLYAPGRRWTDEERRRVDAWHGKSRLEVRPSTFDRLVRGYDPSKKAPPDPAASERRGGRSPVAHEWAPILFGAYLKRCLGRYCSWWGRKRTLLNERERPLSAPADSDTEPTVSPIGQVEHDIERATLRLQLLALLGEGMAPLSKRDRLNLLWFYSGVSDREIQVRLAADGVRMTGANIRKRRCVALQYLQGWMRDRVTGCPAVDGGTHDAR